MTGEDPAPFEAIVLRGRSALAWEVLRRDPAYRAAYQALSAQPVPGVADPEFAARWRMPFRCGSSAQFRRPPTDMVGSAGPLRTFRSPGAPDPTLSTWLARESVG